MYRKDTACIQVIAFSALDAVETEPLSAVPGLPGNCREEHKVFWIGERLVDHTFKDFVPSSTTRMLLAKLDGDSMSCFLKAAKERNSKEILVSERACLSLKLSLIHI